MSDPTERLYALLPAIHRARDAAQGEPLRALLGILETQLQAVEDDIQGLYDNWFIETCDDWVVPYIGDLLGVKGLRAVPGTASYNPRALVANTLRLRRRKGTLGALQEVARDCTGWPMRARRSSVAGVSSVLPSSTMTISSGRSVWAMTLSTASVR